MVVPNCWVSYAFARDKTSVSEAKSIWKKLKLALRKLAKSNEDLALEMSCPTTEVLFHQVDPHRLDDDPLVDFLMISHDVAELPSWERFLVSDIEETSVFALGLEWRDSSSEVFCIFNFRTSTLGFSLIQRDQFEKQPNAMPCWTSFVSFFNLKKHFDGTMRKNDWIPVLVSKKASSKKSDGKTTFELDLGSDFFLTLIHNSESPNIYINYSMPLSSVKEGLCKARDLAESISDPKNPVKTTLNFQIECGDLKKYFKKSKSATTMWTAVQYIGADDDDETTVSTPDPFFVGKVADSGLSCFPIVTLSKDDLLCLQVNIVYADDGSYLEFVSNDPEEWFGWVERESGRTLNRWDGEAKGRWGWYSK